MKRRRAPSEPADGLRRPKHIRIMDPRRNEYLFEEDDKGRKHLVRSKNSRDWAIVRFVNNVSRPVDVWWRDYQGKRQHYARVAPGGYYNVDTFITHPWEFTDGATNENYFVNNNRIFRAPKELANLRYRTVWKISCGVRSLRYAAMMRVAEFVPSYLDVPTLGLPKVLQEDLSTLLHVLFWNEQVPTVRESMA